jgi:probable rRNA maturation factor
MSKKPHSRKPQQQPASNPYQVSIANEQATLTVDREKIRNAVQTVLSGERCKKAKISVAVVDDPTIHELNKRFLKHDYPTDVLTFPMENGAQGLEGEIVVSSDTAVRQAAEYETSPEYELMLYIIHGVLHLLDYDDHNESFALQMRAREQEYLQAIGQIKAANGKPANGKPSKRQIGR